MDSQKNSCGIGLVDLDTSHPQAWLSILRRLGYAVIGVCDGGTVYPPGYAAEFARRNDVPLLFDTVEDMAAHPDVKIAIVHSCDWDLHTVRAAPFVTRGKAVLIDKPIAGRLDHLEQFRAWHNAGARITGGSSLRFAPEVRRLSQRIERDGKPRMLLTGCGVDEFNYGIHAYSMVAGILGPGIEAARHVGIQRGVHQIELRWRDGAQALLWVGGKAWLPFYATVVHTDSVEHLQVNVDTLYDALLEQVMPYLSGVVDRAPLPFEQLIEPEMAALAVQCSLQRAGEWVSLGDRAIARAHYDGAVFGRSYRAAKLGIEQ